MEDRDPMEDKSFRGVHRWRTDLAANRAQHGPRAGDGLYRNAIDALKPFQNPKAVKLTVTTDDELPASQDPA